jgi:hypothetical protein
MPASVRMPTVSRESHAPPSSICEHTGLGHAIHRRPTDAPLATKPAVWHHCES